MRCRLDFKKRELVEVGSTLKATYIARAHQDQKLNVELHLSYDRQTSHRDSPLSSGKDRLRRYVANRINPTGAIPRMDSP